MGREEVIGEEEGISDWERGSDRGGGRHSRWGGNRSRMDEEEELTGPQVDEALKWYNEALSTVSKIFGPDHPEVGG